MTTRPYRAFISYNRADAAIAAALAASLSRFARPWYRTRAMRVFLDKTSLATDPTLSGAIERGLARSEWLVLLASPNSAAAPWVRHELEWWLQHRGVAKLIIARTGGVIAWDGIDGKDFDWAVTTALPPLLRGRFEVEPIWADLEAAAATPRKSLSSPVYRDGFLLVAARIHGVPKDQLWNLEQVEQRKRIAFAATVVSAAALFAWGGYNQYSVSMDRKENLASIQLGAKAFSVLPTDATLAAQIALAGVALRPSGIAASALRSALARVAGPAAPRFELTMPGAVGLAFAPAARQLAVLSGDGRVARLDTISGRRLGDIAPAAPFEARAIAWGRGGRLAIGGDGGLRLLAADAVAAEGASTRAVALPAIRALAFSVDGERVALGHADGSVRIVASTDGATLQTFPAHRGPVRAVAFGNDGTRLASGGEDGEAALWELAGATPVLRLRLQGPIASVDFNREGGSTVAEHMLAVTDTTGALHIVDADAPAAIEPSAPPRRAVALPIAAPVGDGATAGIAARFVTSGRCLARAGAHGPVEVDATLGFEFLFKLGRAADRPATIALALARTRHFALLDAGGGLAVYDQPLCGDAEAVCDFAEGRLTTKMAPALQARWIPGDLDLGTTVQQAPGPACRRLIDRLLRGS